MGEDTTTTAPQAGTDGINLTPQAGDTTTTTPQAGESHKPQKSAEDYERMIADLRKENAGHRTRLNKFEEEAKKAAEAQLTKEQLLEKQYNDLKIQHDEFLAARFETSVKHDVAIEAAKLGVDPSYLDKVARFLDWEEIETDENGNPKNIRAMVEQLVKDMPALTTRGTAQRTSGGATNPPRSQTNVPPEITREYIASLTNEQYMRLSPAEQQRIADAAYSQQWKKR